MDTSVFSYCFSSELIENPHLTIHHNFGKYYFSADAKTPYNASNYKTSECAIFGYAVNVITAECEGLVDEILNTCGCIEDVIEYEKNLGGKYLILYRNNENYYILGDATTSVPVFYSLTEKVICTNNSHVIVENLNLTPDIEYAKIRQSGDISQAMPFDITPYREIKQLIPNHYYDVNNAKAVRFVNASTKQSEISVSEATDKVMPMIDVLTKYYQSIFDIKCPITSGRDSRVVLAFLLANGFTGTCYTIKHPHHTDKTQDITVPAELCAKNAIPYERIEDVIVPDHIKREMDGILGKGQYSERTLQIALTVKEYCKNHAIINGDIIGQVGKCSLHRDIPSVFATPAYFRCKLHNYSDGAKRQLGLWLNEIKLSGEKINTFDLFSIENRMGRWAVQENLIYNTLGQMYLNIFNSRSIIYVWTQVGRKLRKKSLLHIGLIDKKTPALLNIIFQHDDNVVIKLSKSNGILYLLSSYLKYCIEKQRFLRRRKYEKTNNYSG